MADNVQYQSAALATPPASLVVATEEVNGAQIQVVKFSRSESATVSQVPSSASVVTLQDLNASRKHLTVFNDSTAALYIKCGSDASLTSYTVKVLAGGYYDIPDRYTGIVTGIWASANGNAYVTEFI